MLNKKVITKQEANGFTLVELLIVIIVISILSGVVLTVVNPSAMRARARDSQRKSDLAKVQNALEAYYTDFRSYPISTGGNWINAGITGTSLATALVTNYIDILPNDPSYAVNATNPCSRDFNGGGVFDYRYNYRTSNVGSYYILTAIMENAASDDDSKCSALVNWGRATCGAGASTCGCTAGDSYQGSLDYCYGVQNPF